MKIRFLPLLSAMLVMLAPGMTPNAQAQKDIPSKVDIVFNRYNTYEELLEHLQAIAKAYPDLVTLTHIGDSGQGRPIFVATVNAPGTGPDTSKPGMWIDGNVHGNEIQAAEVVLYSLWYLTKAYGVNEDLTKLLDTHSFYFLLSQNPDGREYWLTHANTPHSSRWNQKPVDNDRDGLLDEDGPDDLDGDGSITTMWIKDPDGRWKRDENDPRIFRRVKEDEKGEWTRLGEEGIDNDGDGRINEDGPGGNDMNRDWPTDWKPGYIQWGASAYPLANPETKSIANFILTKPNIMASQSYHNSGGMILRGPGAKYMESAYPREDRKVYDEIGKVGEDILPYYKYMVIYKDLYGVHGGFVNWMAEGLGAYSFTNELWTNGKYFQRDVQPDEKLAWLFRDRLQFGQTFKAYTEYDHPQYGKILIGGLNKWSMRTTPTFMLEEECHRNFAFTMFHAAQMAQLEWGPVTVKRAAGGDSLWVVTAEVRNTQLMPTRSAIQAKAGIGQNDLLVCEPAQGTVMLAGKIRDRRDRSIDEIRHEPGRIQLPKGVPGHGRVLYRFYIRGEQGQSVRLRYQAQRAQDIDMTFTLEPAQD